MVATFLIFCLIWLLLSAFGTFMGYCLFTDTSIFTIGAYACLISWFIAFIITLIRSVSKSEIMLVQKEKAEMAKYKDHKGSTAILISGARMVQGHLYQFPDELIFHPGALKEEKEDMTIPYKNITDVRIDEETKKLCIETTGGVKNFFAVPDKQKWINELKEIETTQPSS